MQAQVTISGARNTAAERPRFPRPCQSAGGQSGPNAYPKGEVDGQAVNIPLPARCQKRRRRGVGACRRNCTLKGTATSRQYAKATAEAIIRHIDFQEKRTVRPVPQTDTGGRDENSKALERFMVKELGKMDPQLREKGRPPPGGPQ
eukprot:TRINITY_DN665_c0_g1_i6.p2 TRINITY_DN665_c0_g1~~TRINITY_DN665_c0_g1_i6.p2  ORF type:complete len:146 (-),score=24.90 TRINITY_DN665_c0_g1_i6:123-560(-)